ncbi:hypothetical protein FJTKL_08827 [Diaporthe vaccinii]|uniref:Uncharacterized protein n=1 Tax=Diaporthe vaccinii TaxID=105482 RepID=A0ABR4EPQ3_9PEZI
MGQCFWQLRVYSQAANIRALTSIIASSIASRMASNIWCSSTCLFSMRSTSSLTCCSTYSLVAYSRAISSRSRSNCVAI